MQTINIKVGETFINEIYAAEMHQYENGQAYAQIYSEWNAHKATKPNMKSLTVKVTIDWCAELLSWAEFNASASDDDAEDYLPLRAYCRRLVRRVREQGWKYEDGKMVQIATAESIAKIAKPKPVRKQKTVKQIGKQGFLFNDLLGLSGGMDD